MNANRKSLWMSLICVAGAAMISGQVRAVPLNPECLVVDLVAGQHFVAGKVTVCNDASEMSITFDTGTTGWKISEVHVDVQQFPWEFPLTPTGNPKVGHFEYFQDGGNGTSVTITIPRWSLPVAPDYTQCVVIAAHAVVSKGGKGSETAWGRGTPFTAKRNWGMFMEYCLTDTIYVP